MLCKIGLGNEGIIDIGIAITTLMSFQYLDVSHNSIRHKGLSKFFEIISSKNRLKSLDISNNNCKSTLNTNERYKRA